MLWAARATTLHLVGAASTEGAEHDERRDQGHARGRGGSPSRRSSATATISTLTALTELKDNR
jgi:hypothetical protein